MFYSYLSYRPLPLLTSNRISWFGGYKVKSLIEDRKIELFVRQHNYSPVAARKLMRLIFKLQKLVYRLDSYGEKNWVLDTRKINKRWNRIVRFLSKFGIAEPESVKLLTSMNSYMDIEIGMRSNKLPNRLSIGDYYEFKICDVQLQRELIKRNATCSHNNEYYRLWRLIDIISEIIDDVDDVEEDSLDFNCNRLIIATHFGAMTIIKNEPYHHE